MQPRLDRLLEWLAPVVLQGQPLAVDADEVRAFVAANIVADDPSLAPHQILHLWLTETLVPRHLGPPVFQALARYGMRAPLQEAAQAPF